MKGITPVIALILLLVIVIVVVGFSFGIFQSIISTAGQSAEQQATTQSQNILKTARLESCAPGTGDGSITVRNMGDEFAALSIGVYVNGAPIDCSTKWSPATIPAGGVSTCGSITIATGATIRVTSPSGAVDTGTC